MEEIRAKLLNYRLVNYDEVRRSEFDVTNLTVQPAKLPVAWEHALSMHLIFDTV